MAVPRRETSQADRVRPEYPRPEFVREDWLNLNGTWEFEFDDDNAGLHERWHEGKAFSRRIVVPFTFESRLSGIGDTSIHEVVWYRRTFKLPSTYQGRRILLNFGAVDYKAAVWVNGELVAEHRGGYTPFSCDITESLRPENTVVVRAEDRATRDQPRGKQHFEPESKGCHYSRATGIWQTVWIEPVAPFHLTHLRFIPDVAHSRVKVTAGVSGHNDNTTLKLRFSIDGKVKAETTVAASSDEISVEIRLSDAKLWTPDDPNLYNVLFELQEDGTIFDRVLGYFGMRSIRIEGNRILLNGEPCYLRLVLDQGYWQDGIYTAPSDESYKRDIEATRALGFNGVRKHQKVEDPRYYYWCDRLGLLVWCEMANAYDFNEVSMANFASEWPQVVKQNFNHPSIVTWVPFNESWGLGGVQDEDRPQEFVGQIVAFTRQLDPTRPVVDNSGWSHVDTDIVDLHEYSGDAGLVFRTLSDIAPEIERLPQCTHKKPAMADGFPYRGQPVVVSEYGGIALARDTGGPAWGYGNGAKDASELVRRYRDLTESIARNKAVAGFCYTQLYDIEQEVNGLLTYDRELKIRAEEIATINRGV